MWYRKISIVEILFIHPNFPGQFRQLAKRLLSEAGYSIRALGDVGWMSAPEAIAGLNCLTYTLPESANASPHPYLKGLDSGVRRGLHVAKVLTELKVTGYEPDIIYLHPGWGDGLYVKTIYPNAVVIGLFEYFYQARGADVGFDPQFPLTMDDLFRVPTLNALQLLALESCDVRLSATQWQRSRYPQAYQASLRCIHEGIDTDLIKPDSAAEFTLPNGALLHAGDEVLTFVSRGFEPYRGFHIFMRALPLILHERPNCQVVMVGGESNHYGPAPSGNYSSWKEKFLQEAGSSIDMTRVHFTGTLEFAEYLKVLQISRLHVYLTYPFVLSWSMLEAMAAGCLVLASDTSPVQEVIAHEVNGLLAPFFDVGMLVDSAVHALAEPGKYDEIRKAAVTTIKKRYDFAQIVYPEHLKMLQSLKLQKDNT